MPFELELANLISFYSTTLLILTLNSVQFRKQTDCGFQIIINRKQMFISLISFSPILELYPEKCKLLPFSGTFVLKPINYS